VGRFRAVDAARYPRGTRVVVRTVRGLEVGEVLAPPGEAGDAASGMLADGAILRQMSVQDALLETRLESHRERALEACQDLLAQRESPAVLLDVEHLFDGRGLYFYFLGGPPPDVDRLTAELSQVWDTQIEFRQFADTLTNGCGPDCGTEKGSGGGCAACATGCAIAGACGVAAR